MKKITLGTPEKLVPSTFCPGFSYKETSVSYDISAIDFRENARGCVITLPLCPDEHIYGFGLQLKSLEHRGHKMTLRPNADPVAATGDSHAPVPFFVSTKGYGVYVDTARHAEFYCGASPSGSFGGARHSISLSTNELYAAEKPSGKQQMVIQLPAAKGADIYIIEGKNITDIVSQYNMLSGGGADVPEWALGVYYRCCSGYDDEHVKGMADYLRDSGIPCSVLGLEPGWQTRAYSCSFVWDGGRFPDPSALNKYLSDKNYHINLWEHAFTHPDSPLYAEMRKGCCEYDVWGGAVPDFALPSVRKAFADYHKNNIVGGVVDGFKLDECDGSDITGGWTFPCAARFPSGLDGEQYHSLFGTLYMQTILEALGGKATYSNVRNAGALCSPYPFALYSDLYDHRDFIRGCVTSGFGGLLWAPEVRHAESKEDLIRRLQTAVFSAQCLINAWYCEQAPWLPLDCEKQAREVLLLREGLKDRLSAAFKLYKTKGIAPVRALVSDYTDDPETYGIDNEYLLGSDLLVAPMVAGERKRSVYLPQGKWRNYFTDAPAPCGRFDVETENIPVYIKE